MLEDRGCLGAPTKPVINDGVLMVMKLLQHGSDLVTGNRCNSSGLREIPEIHERANSDDNLGVCCTGDDSDNESLDVPLGPSADLLEARDSTRKVAETSDMWEDGESEVQFIRTKGHRAPANVVVPELVMPLM